MQRVQAAVKDVFGPVNPREDITLERLSHLILDVRKKVEGSTETERREHKWLTYLLPPRDQEDFVLQESGMDAMNSPTQQRNDPLEEQHQPSSPSSNPSLRRLLDETSDLIDSPTFTHVLTLLLNATFSHLIDQRIAAEAFKVVPATTPSRIEELDAKCKVAQTLAVFCRQAHVIAAGSSEADELAAVTSEAGTANEYLAKIDAVRDLEGFAAVIYSSNFEFEAVEDEDGAAPVPRQPATVELPVTDQPPVASEQPNVHDEIDKIDLPEPVPEAPAFENAWEKALAKEGDN